MGQILTTEQEARREKLLAAIERKIDPVKTPVQYKMALLLAAVIMVLLPIIYVAIACAFAAVVYYHAIYSVAIFQNVRGRGVIMAVIIYVGPLIAGVTAVLFMLKPLFSRAPKADRPTSLSRDDEPILFQFVDKLCDTVHAPRPKRIDVDCQVNASAGFHRGWFSMLLGNDLVLTVGLPLITGMTARQFGGILAHEFGHFAQGGGMRLSYIIRTVSHWFTRVVYERDSWDVNLERWSKENDIRIGVIFYLARGCVWLTRRILWVLMMVGHGVSGLLLRQMEFDADRHEVRFSGSDQIEPTTRRLHELMVAHNMAFSDVSLAYREGRLADDLIRLVALNADELPEDVESRIDKQISDGKTGWLDTHPCDRERIASGLKDGADGVFHLDVPATDLFVDFEGVSRLATVNMYRAMLGEEFREDGLQPTEDIVVAREAQKKASQALGSFTQNGWTPLQEFPVPFVELPKSDSSGSEPDDFRNLRDDLFVSIDAQKQAVERIEKADQELSECVRAGLLLDAEFQIPATTFSRNLSTKAMVTEETKSINHSWSVAEEDYNHVQDVIQQRLWMAIGLLNQPSVQLEIPEASAWVADCNERLLPALQKLMALRTNVMNFRSDSERFLVCLQLLENGNQSEGLYRETRKSMGEVPGEIRQLLKSFGSTPYPFEHLDREMTIAKYLCSKVPDAESPGDIYSAITSITGNYFELYQRILGRLCQMACAVEEHFGLPMLPVPESTDVAEEGQPG